MKRAIGKILSHPVLSVVLLLIWLLLVKSMAWGHVILGAILAVLIPRLTARLWMEEIYFHRYRVLARLIGIVLWDILVASIIVTRLILGPGTAPRPRFVVVPLDMTNPYAIAMLASIISLTPGTVSVSLSDDNKGLLLHGLDVPDVEELIRSVKTRYETPIKEIFEC